MGRCCYTNILLTWACIWWLTDHG